MSLDPESTRTFTIQRFVRDEAQDLGAQVTEGASGVTTAAIEDQVATEEPMEIRIIHGSGEKRSASRV